MNLNVETKRLASLQTYITPFLKPECVQKNILEITINDLALSRLAEFEKSYLELLRGFLTEKNYSIILREQGAFIPNFTSISQLTQNKKAEIDRQIEDHAKDLFKLQRKAFLKGERLAKLDAISSKKQPHFQFGPMDFTVLMPADILQRSVDPKKEQLKIQMNFSLKHKQAQGTMEMIYQLDEITGGLCQIQWLTALANQENKTIFDLSEDECYGDVKILKTLVSEAMERKRAKADLIFEELMNESSMPTAVKKTIEKTLPTKNTDVAVSDGKEEAKTPTSNQVLVKIDPLQLLIADINRKSYVSSYHLHEHVSRWAVKKIGTIRNFQDFDLERNAVVKRYEKCNTEELIRWKNVHHLSGIERFFSNQEFVKSYTLPYKYVNRANEPQSGRYLFCTMDYKGKKEVGFIFVGIDEMRKEIYHALFEPYKKQGLVTSEMKVMVEKLKSFKLSSFGENWNFDSHFLFTFEEDQVIRLSVDSVEDSKVIFDFHPIFPSLNK